MPYRSRDTDVFSHAALQSHIAGAFARTLVIFMPICCLESTQGGGASQRRAEVSDHIGLVLHLRSRQSHFYLSGVLDSSSDFLFACRRQKKRKRRETQAIVSTKLLGTLLSLCCKTTHSMFSVFFFLLSAVVHTEKRTTHVFYSSISISPLLPMMKVFVFFPDLLSPVVRVHCPQCDGKLSPLRG